MGKKLNSKLECKDCHTIYLTLTRDVFPNTPMDCSSCGGYSGGMRLYLPKSDTELLRPLPAGSLTLETVRAGTE